MTISNHSSDLTERVRLRLNDPNYCLSHDEQQENQFVYVPEMFVTKWSLPARSAVFTFGLFGLILSTRTKGIFRTGLGILGIGSLIRAITNLHATDLIGWVANPCIRLRRTIRVRAPIDDVYDFLSHFNNYSKFMSYVNKVEVNEQGGLRWTLRGPAGILFHVDSTLGRMMHNQAISWKSSVNSLLRNSGDIQLRDLAEEGTEIRIELMYAPPVGALGYAVVHFLGFDPKEKIDEDMQVLKAHLEKDVPSNQELIDFHRA